MNDTLRQEVLPVAISILVLISIAILRAHSKTLAAITATMPINIPLAVWIVYSGEHGNHATMVDFTGSLFAGIGATTVFVVALWLAARAGLGLIPMLVVSYLTWAAVLGVLYLARLYLQ